MQYRFTGILWTLFGSTYSYSYSFGGDRVSTEARAERFPAVDWDGGAFPYRVGHRKLGMWLFIVSDSLTFSALLIGYSYLRASNVWPTPFPFYPIIVFSSVMPFSLPEHWVQTFTTSDGRLPSPLFGATFFTITGLHMFHVATGIIYLGVVAARVKKVNHEDIEISGLYWHFVDLVWMFVFPLIYILSVDVGCLLYTSD